MASNVTLSVYLGAGETGIANDKLISEEAAKRNMTKSEFVLYAALKEVERGRNKKN